VRPSLRPRWIVGVVFVAAVGAAGAGIGVMRAGAKPSSPLALVPANFAALNAASTAVPSVPPQTPSPSAEYGPRPGALHALGHGKAFAWVHAGAVCSQSSNFEGCADPSPSIEHGIDITISDEDLLRQGKPAHVSGLAVDSVVRVTATLKDGSALSTAPIDNWYDLTLPENAAPWDVVLVAARTASGRTISQTVTLHAPAAR
jgi:hypothetical protein